MTQLANRFKLFYVRLRGFFPEALPTGMTAYTAWQDTLLAAYGFPANDSLKFALATMVLHLKPTQAYVPKRFFALSIHKGMAAQVACGVMDELKSKQKAMMEAEQQAAAIKKQAEATALNVEQKADVASNVTPIKPA